MHVVRIENKKLEWIQKYMDKRYLMKKYGITLVFRCLPSLTSIFQPEQVCDTPVRDIINTYE